MANGAVPSAALLLAILFIGGIAGVPGDMPENQLLDRGYRDMYNLDFRDAHRVFQQWEQVHPNDPFGPVSDAAAYLFFEFDRLKVLRSDFFVHDGTFLNSKQLKPDPNVKRAFEQDIESCRKLAQAQLSQSPNDEDALFSTVVALALQADYEALIEKQYWTALKGIRQATTQAAKLLEKYPDCYDAHLAGGVENYLLSLRPAAVRLFLRLAGAQADREKGIEELRIVAQKGNYLKPYAKVLLAIAALRNNNPQQARRLVAELAQQFPQNDLFRDELKKLDCGQAAC